MRCAEFEARWNEVLDRRELVEGDWRLQVHLECCATCRERCAGFESICEILGRRSALTPAGDLAERVLVELSAGPNISDSTLPAESSVPVGAIPLRGKPRGGQWARAMIGMAAATLIALYLPGRFEARSSRPSPSRQRFVAEEFSTQRAITGQSIAGSANTASPATGSPVTGSPVTGSPVTGSPVRPQIATKPAARHQQRPSVASLRNISPQSYRELARGTGQNLALVVLSLPDVAVELANNSRADYAAANQAWTTVTESLRPVATSMNETWQILKRALPAVEPPHG